MTNASHWIIQRYSTLPTTMDRAALLADLGAPERTAVVSGEQTAGRGRGGRAWQSARDAGLYCTLILRPGLPPDRLSPLSLIAGVAVAEAIAETTGSHARLKWPNDVWLGDDPMRQKAAGILLSSSLTSANGPYVLLGIGINIAAPHAALPDGATSILAATGAQPTPAELLASLLTHIDRAYDAFLAAGGRSSLDAWRARAALLGEQVSILDGARQHTGTFVDIDDDGALLLSQHSGQIIRIVAGDLVRGPRPPG